MSTPLGIKNKDSDRLRYLNDFSGGYSRKKSRKSFVYYNAVGGKITDTDELNRIKALVIPPAWKNVWISPFSNSHLQATGIDAKGRKQYRYHSEWNKKRSETKFSRLVFFARALPKIRALAEKHLKNHNAGREKVLAAVIDLMSKSYIRIGNASYEKQNGSYGLTTLKDKHVVINGNTLKFVFKGKKGVMQEVELHDKRLARIVKQCKDIPGQELFQYFDEEGNRHDIDSGDINSYLHVVCGEEFSAKDFRTWAGSLHAFKELCNIPAPESEADFKRKTAEVVKYVSQKLGNTPAVCRKYYIHPLLIESFSKGELIKFYQSRNEESKLKAEELLIEFLENNAELKKKD